MAKRLGILNIQLNSDCDPFLFLIFVSLIFTKNFCSIRIKLRSSCLIQNQISFIHDFWIIKARLIWFWVKQLDLNLILVEQEFFVKMRETKIRNRKGSQSEFNCKIACIRVWFCRSNLMSTEPNFDASNFIFRIPNRLSIQRA